VRMPRMTREEPYATREGSIDDGSIVVRPHLEVCEPTLLTRIREDEHRLPIRLLTRQSSSIMLRYPWSQRPKILLVNISQSKSCGFDGAAGRMVGISQLIAVFISSSVLTHP